MATYDLVVVGAGPAGSMAAYTAARKGLRVLLLEEHPDIGTPSHCTGKLHVAAFQEFALPERVVLNRVRGAVFYAPDGRSFTVAKPNPDSYIMDRILFDRILAERAIDAGAELLVKARALKARPKPTGDSCVQARVNGGSVREFRAKIVIDAEGANPKLLEAPRGGGFRLKVKGLQYELSGCDIDEPDFVEVYFGRCLAPGFFAWLVPLGPRSARVGLCVDYRLTDGAVRRYLDRAVKEIPALARKLEGARVERVFGGQIPILGFRGKTYADGLMIVGDAAGHTKSTSGGGIYFGMKAGEIAANAACECLEEGDWGAGSLGRYERRWKKLFGRETRFTAIARTALNSLSDQELNTLAAALASTPALRRVVEAYGDTAYQSRFWNPFILRLAMESLNKPALLRLVFKLALKSLSARLNG